MYLFSALSGSDSLYAGSYLKIAIWISTKPITSMLVPIFWLLFFCPWLFTWWLSAFCDWISSSLDFHSICSIIPPPFLSYILIPCRSGLRLSDFNKSKTSLEVVITCSSWVWSHSVSALAMSKQVSMLLMCVVSASEVSGQDEDVVWSLTPLPCEEYSSRTGSGDCLGNMLYLFPWPFIPLSFPHLFESGFHSKDFVSVPASFLFTLLHKKRRGMGFSWTPEFVVPLPLSQDWCAGKIQLFKPPQAASTAALCTGKPCTHTHPLLWKNSRCFCKAPGIRGDAPVGKQLLYWASACLPPLRPVLISKLKEEVARGPAPANWLHPFDTAGMLKFRILATYASMT